MKKIKGGIIAAGLGSRFTKSNVTTFKAMIPINNTPLIGWVMNQFITAEIFEITAIFNTKNAFVCQNYVRNDFSKIKLQSICKDTASSFESFFRVLSSGKDEYLLITTVDSIYAPGKLKKFKDFCSQVPENAIVLGFSDYIEDEKPLYIEVDNKGKVISLGKNKTSYVTCGVYFLHSSLANNVHYQSFSALRKFLGSLVEKGVPTYGFFLGKSVDVDRPLDKESAEQWVKTFEK